MPDSLNRLVACTSDDSRIIGICGETKLANERESLTTMIQVSYSGLLLTDSLSDTIPLGVRVLHLAQSDQGIRVALWIRYLSTWMFLRLPYQNGGQRSTDHHLLSGHR